jgi:hypothetical protein
MLDILLNILGWNVRGLNDQDRRDTFHKSIASSSYVTLRASEKLSLDDPVSKEEVKAAINQALGPDGFTGAFFKRCWGTIKVGVMNVVQLFGGLHVENFH